VKSKKGKAGFDAGLFLGGCGRFNRPSSGGDLLFGFAVNEPPEFDMGMLARLPTLAAFKNPASPISSYSA